MSSMALSPNKEPMTSPGTFSGPRAGGKEELRANLLKPYLLRLRSVKDDSAVRALMSLAGIPLSVIDDETGWISVAAGKRALGAVEDALGAGVLTRLRQLAHPPRKSRHLRAHAAHRAKASRRLPISRPRAPSKLAASARSNSSSSLPCKCA